MNVVKGTPLRERLWQSVEGSIDAFHDTDREVLPDNAWEFILYFARQAKGLFTLLLIAGCGGPPGLVRPNQPTKVARIFEVTAPNEWARFRF